MSLASIVTPTLHQESEEFCENKGRSSRAPLDVNSIADTERERESKDAEARKRLVQHGCDGRDLDGVRRPVVGEGKREEKVDVGDGCEGELRHELQVAVGSTPRQTSADIKFDNGVGLELRAGYHVICEGSKVLTQWKGVGPTCAKQFVQSIEDVSVVVGVVFVYFHMFKDLAALP